LLDDRLNECHKMWQPQMFPLRGHNHQWILWCRRVKSISPSI
jgi:hypothetical protein